MSLRERTRPGSGIIEPCLPSPAKVPPSGPGWIHEIKHDGFRIIARRDSAGVRLFTRNGNDFTMRFPLAVAAIAELPGRSFLIDGEAIVTNDKGLAVFELIRRTRNGGAAVLCAFDLIELDGEDLRREPIEDRKHKLSRLVRTPRPGIVVNEHYNSHGEIVFEPPASSAVKASCRSGLGRPIAQGASIIGSK
jgi:bifunctional non-homologous end joining protein LigD